MLVEGTLLWAIGSGVVTAVFTGGVCFGSVRQALNGTRLRVKSVEDAVNVLDTKMDEHSEKITIVATKVDTLLGRK